MNGTILDVQPAQNGTSLDVWLVDDANGCMKVNVPWCPSIHVHATRQRLKHLWAWLEQPEIRDRFGLGMMRIHRSRLSLDASEVDEVLEIDVHNSWNLRKAATHIESRGQYQHFTLYSVDAHLAQRFLVEHRVAPFQKVVWVDGVFNHEGRNDDMNPTLDILHMAFVYSTANGFHTANAELERVEFRTCPSEGTCD
ncbi:MAG: hypothetical protein HN444_04025, partial [Euryarchaeota archaeon]|nr:hypothetical protein [Euryarchaeota archaeon]